jgi:hypothetical protein
MTYQVWEHAVQVSAVNGRWTVAVDETMFEKWFMTEAEAWEAGVREADRLELSAARRSSVDPFGTASTVRQ